MVDRQPGRGRSLGNPPVVLPLHLPGVRLGLAGRVPAPPDVRTLLLGEARDRFATGCHGVLLPDWMPFGGNK